ncbi:hypothetical protein ACV07N_12015 [Roseivirga echinicomitans]
MAIFLISVIGVLQLHAAVPHEHHKIDLTFLDHHAHHGRIHAPNDFQDELIESGSEVKVPSFDIERRLKTNKIEKAPAFSFISSNRFLLKTLENERTYLPYLAGKHLIFPKAKPDVRGPPSKA